MTTVVAPIYTLTEGVSVGLQTMACAVMLAMTAGCGAVTAQPETPPKPVGTIRAGCASACATEAPTTPLPPDAYPPLDGMGAVTDVGHITNVEYVDGHPVLIWNRIFFHFCTQQEKDEEDRRRESPYSRGSVDCLDDYALRDISPVLRRYRVATDAVLLIPDRNSSGWAIHRAGIDKLPELTGPHGPILVSVNAAGEVATIGEAYMP
jgi:hypothetical protein